MKQKYLSSGIQKKYLKSTLILLLLALLLSMIGVWSYMHHTLKNNIIEKRISSAPIIYGIYVFVLVGSISILDA